LQDALVALELAPLHETLVCALKADLLEELASLSEPLPACEEEAEESTPAAQLMQRIEEVSLRFVRDGASMFASKTGSTAKVDEKGTRLSLCKNLHALKNVPEIDSPEAALVLPGPDPALVASLAWGPAWAYALIDAIAESDPATAVEVFDRLRLREPLAKAFSGGGDIHEDGWRAAARVRLAFFLQTLRAAKPSAADESFAGLPARFWDDPDARWLLNVHKAGEDSYFNKELHQQMLWWTKLPALLRLADAEPVAKKSAGKPETGKKRSAASSLSPAPTSLSAIKEEIQQASEQAEDAGFRLGRKKEPTLKGAKDGADLKEEADRETNSESNQEKGALAK
jgi:hypothetical protein